MGRKPSVMSRSSAFCLVIAVALVILVSACVGILSRRAEQDRQSVELMRALAQGDARTALVALDRGADPNASALLLMETPPRSIRERLLALFKRPRPDHDRAGTTALLVALDPDVLTRLPPTYARFGRRIPPSAPTALIRALLDRGASPNMRGPSGVTALYEAAIPVRPDVIRLLLDHGADPNGTGPGGATALMMASCRAGRQSVQDLLACGADPNRRDSRQMTALLWAASRGDVEPVVDLLAHGADPNARGPRGQSALMLAVQGSWADPPTGDSLLRALLSHGADSNLRDSSGRTASMTATDPVVRRVLARVLQDGTVH